MVSVPDFRIKKCNEARENPQGDYVLYWMIAHRRTHWNYGLQRAVEWSRRFGRPLLVLEALRCGYPWASDRIHCFVMEGMRDNAGRLRNSGILYYPYIEDEPDRGKGLLTELSDRACVVVTDDFPAFFLPRMVNAAARQLSVRMEEVDSNGLLPIGWTDRVFQTALSFRRFLQKNLEPHLYSMPLPDPLAEELPRFNARIPIRILERWPLAQNVLSVGSYGSPACFPIDHSVPRSPVRGGALEANRTLDRFLDERLERYADSRNHPDDDVTSGLSPYLHFGHISVHQIFQELAFREGWKGPKTLEPARGQREGWWGMSRNAEAFLDQIITWRELGYNMCAHSAHCEGYESVPEWARETLDKHRNDPRPYLYTQNELENAQTHDPIWNAAQRQLRREGRIHNYLRMLWGKKILEWTLFPEEALSIMIDLNNKYALDGRNPNSYSGIMWTLGRYDRPWAPERPVMGRIRYMSSQSAVRKLRLKQYLKIYSE